jgi:hypothetical protein
MELETGCDFASDIRASVGDDEICLDVGTPSKYSFFHAAKLFWVFFEIFFKWKFGSENRKNCHCFFFLVFEALFVIITSHETFEALFIFRRFFERFTEYFRICVAFNKTYTVVLLAIITLD